MLGRNTISAEAKKAEIETFFKKLDGDRDTQSALEHKNLNLACNIIAAHLVKTSTYYDEAIGWLEWAARNEDVAAIYNLAYIYKKFGERHGLLADLYLFGWIVAKDNDTHYELSESSLKTKKKSEYRNHFESELSDIAAKTHVTPAHYTAKFALHYISCHDEKHSHRVTRFSITYSYLNDLRYYVKTKDEQHRFGIKQTLLAKAIEKSLSAPREKIYSHFEKDDFEILLDLADDKKYSHIELKQAPLPLIQYAFQKADAKNNLARLKQLFLMTAEDTDEEKAFKNAAYLKLTANETIHLQTRKDMFDQLKFPETSSCTRNTQIKFLLNFDKNMKQSLVYRLDRLYQGTDSTLAGDRQQIFKEWSAYFTRLQDPAETFFHDLLNNPSSPGVTDFLSALTNHVGHFDYLIQLFLRNNLKQFVQKCNLNIKYPDSFNPLSFKQLSEIITSCYLLCSILHYHELDLDERPSLHLSDMIQIALGRILVSHRNEPHLEGLLTIIDILSPFDTRVTKKDYSALNSAILQKHPLALYYVLKGKNSKLDIPAAPKEKEVAYCEAILNHDEEKNPTCIPKGFLLYMKLFAQQHLRLIAAYQPSQSVSAKSSLIKFSLNSFTMSTVEPTNITEYKPKT